MFSIFKGLSLSQDELDQYYIQKRKRYYEKHGAVPKFIKLYNFLHRLLVPCKVVREITEEDRISISMNK